MSNPTLYRRGLVQAPPPSAARRESAAAKTMVLNLGGNFRPEIEGLRAVAVVLVASYHIWLGRVSGGVDVFLFLTGFLITGSLIRMVDRYGRVRFLRFWSRLVARLVPAAAATLLLVMVVTFFVLPQTRWRDTIDEIIAAAFYYENWHLALGSVDYLAKDAAVSPVQHFWSLSIQGQFYIAWALVIAAIAFAVKRADLPLRPMVFLLCAVVFAVSLVYSISKTADNQPWAYFDSGARAWEFALGGMLAILLPHLRFWRNLRVAMGWLGLIGLISCGLVLTVSTQFPGYIALWPTGAAMLVILAGTTGERYAADRLLTWRPLTFIGGHAYALYLVHWPLLIGYRELTGESTASWYGGLYLLVLSFLVALAVKWMMEDGTGWLIRTRKRFKPAWSLTAGVVYLSPVLLVATVWTGNLDAEREELASAVIEHPEDYPGALALSDPSVIVTEDVEIVPQPADARDDVPVLYDQGCHIDFTATEAKVCEFGDPNGEYTVAIVGGSRSAHWFPALDETAQANGWRLLNITKSSCLFDTAVPHNGGAVYQECIEWRNNVMDVLSEIRPDLVVTSSTRAVLGDEFTPQGYVERWQQLDVLGIDVLAIRDLPRSEFDVADCMGGDDAEDCAFPAENSQAPTDPTKDVSLPDNVTAVDLTDYVCPERQCVPVIGNILVYRDSIHLTATYAASMAPLIEEEILQATGW